MFLIGRLYRSLPLAAILISFLVVQPFASDRFDDTAGGVNCNANKIGSLSCNTLPGNAGCPGTLMTKDVYRWPCKKNVLITTAATTSCRTCAVKAGDWVVFAGPPPCTPVR